MIGAAAFDHYTIVGGGPMGLVLAGILSNNVKKINIWLSDNRTAQDWSSKSTIRIYNRDFQIPTNANIVTGQRFFESGSHCIVAAVPTQQFEEVMEPLIQQLNPNKIHSAIIFSKGFLSSVSRRKYDAHVLHEYIEKIGESRGLKLHTAMVSGPSLLADLYNENHTFFTIGSKSDSASDLVKILFRSPYIAYDTTDDMMGVEIGGVMKNPVAIMAGITDYLEDAGSSLRGELAVQGFSEIMKMGTVLGARSETLVGRSGLADLIATAFSSDSRNRNYGRKFMERIQSGELEANLLERIELFIFPARYIEREVMQSSDLVEGGLSLSLIIDIAKEHEIELPLFQALFDIFSRRKPPSTLVSVLTGRKDDAAIPVTRKRAHLEWITSGQSLAQALKDRIMRKVTTTRGMRNRIRKQAGHVISSLEKRKRKAEARKLKNDAANFEKELNLWTQFRNSSQEHELLALDRIIDFYTHAIGDSYVPVIRGTLMNLIAPFRFLIGFMKRGSIAPVVGGPVADIRKLADQYPVYYAPTHKTHIDSVELAYALAFSRLPLPRFAAASILMSNPLWGRFLKSMGAYAVDRESTRNILYLETLSQYSVIMLEAGIPALAYPEGTRSRTGNYQPIKTGLLSTAIDAFKGSGQEIIIVPMAISHRWIPEDLEFTDQDTRTGVFRFIKRRKKVYLDFGKPIRVSEYMQLDDPTHYIAKQIHQSWKESLKIQPHYILARLLAESKGPLHHETAAIQMQGFIDSHKANFAEHDAAKALKKARKILKSRKLIKEDKSGITIMNKPLIEFYGRMATVDELHDDEVPVPPGEPESDKPSLQRKTLT